MVGDKGANFGELSRINGIRVPEGFCVTTAAFKETIVRKDSFGGNHKEFDALLDQQKGMWKSYEHLSPLFYF